MTDLAQTRGATWMEMGVVTMATMGVASGLGRPGYETIYDTCETIPSHILILKPEIPLRAQLINTI